MLCFSNLFWRHQSLKEINILLCMRSSRGVVSRKSYVEPFIRFYIVYRNTITKFITITERELCELESLIGCSAIPFDSFGISRFNVVAERIAAGFIQHSEPKLGSSIALFRLGFRNLKPFALEFALLGAQWKDPRY